MVTVVFKSELWTRDVVYGIFLSFCDYILSTLWFLFAGNLFLGNTYSFESSFSFPMLPSLHLICFTAAVQRTCTSNMKTDFKNKQKIKQIHKNKTKNLLINKISVAFFQVILICLLASYQPFHQIVLTPIQHLCLSEPASNWNLIPSMSRSSFWLMRSESSDHFGVKVQNGSNNWYIELRLDL